MLIWLTGYGFVAILGVDGFSPLSLATTCLSLDRVFRVLRRLLLGVYQALFNCLLNIFGKCVNYRVD